MLAEGTAVAFTSVIERSARSFLIGTVCCPDEVTATIFGQLCPKEGQGILCTSSVANTLRFLIVLQAISTSAFWRI